MLLFGLAKFAQLKRLKNSVRNSPRQRSVNGRYFTTEKSTFFCPGPVRMLRPVFPNGALGEKKPPVRVEETKAVVLKNCASLSCVRPEPSMLPVKPGRRFARWMVLLSGAWMTENGRPDWNVAMPLTPQSFRSQRAAESLPTRPGRSATKLVTKRCVRLKSERPRFVFQLRWSPGVETSSLIVPPE